MCLGLHKRVHRNTVWIREYDICDEFLQDLIFLLLNFPQLQQFPANPGLDTAVSLDFFFNEIPEKRKEDHLP